METGSVCIVGGGEGTDGRVPECDTPEFLLQEGGGQVRREVAAGDQGTDPGHGGSQPTQVVRSGEGQGGRPVPMLERGELDGVRLRGGETQEFRKQGGGGGIPPNPPAGGGGWRSRDEVHLGVRMRGRPGNGPSGGGGELVGHTPFRGVGHMVSWPASGRHTLGAILRSPGGAGSGQGVWRPRPSGGIPAAARKHDTLVDGPERGAGGGGVDGEAYDAGGDAREDENTRDGGG